MTSLGERKGDFTGEGEKNNVIGGDVTARGEENDVTGVHRTDFAGDDVAGRRRMSRVWEIT